MREKNWGKVSDLETFEALAPGIQKRNVFGPDTGWNDYVMRHFILPQGIAIPPHCHDWDHLALSLEGHGEVVVEGEHCDLEKGTGCAFPPERSTFSATSATVNLHFCASSPLTATRTRRTAAASPRGT